jgi:hypothetical protein
LLNGIDKKTNAKIRIQLYVGWFEIAETTLCLTWRFLQFLYRLSIWQLIGFSYGVSFPRRISWNAWQGATVYWWLLRIFLTGLLGGLLVDYNMSRRYITGFLFRWLIFYIDPFGSVSCKFWIVRNFLVNGHVHLLMQSRSLPHFEKKNIDACLYTGLFFNAQGSKYMHQDNKLYVHIILQFHL